MMDSGEMENLKTGNALIQMERFMKVNGRRENPRDMGLKHGQMVESIKVIGKWGNP